MFIPRYKVCYAAELMLIPRNKVFKPWNKCLLRGININSAVLVLIWLVLIISSMKSFNIFLECHVEATVIIF